MRRNESRAQTVYSVRLLQKLKKPGWLGNKEIAMITHTDRGRHATM